ncbi:anti-sigma factor, partial [Mycobacterium ulcerans]
MTEPTDFQLLELATPYALHAVSDEERLDIERRLSAAPAPVAAAFDEEVRSVRETMSVVSAATAAQPPAELRQALLAAAEPAQSRRQPRWRTAVFASAAAIAVGAGARS